MKTQSTRQTGLSTAILDIIFEFRNLARLKDRPDDTVEDEKSREFQKDRIDGFVQKHEPVHMILPAFPAKSPNPGKTVSHKPDYGEVLALTRLNDLCEKIRSIYSPGAHMTICSDGRVFSDIVQVCDGTVDVYGRGIRDIIREKSLSNLSTYSLDDVYSAHNYGHMRSRLVTEYAEAVEDIRTRVKNDAGAKMLFNGIHRFMFEDQLAMHNDKSKSWIREHSKTLAYQVIQRSNAWSRLVERRFPNGIRLSIHPQPVQSVKIGIKLLPSDDLWRTPWHSVLVRDGEHYFLAPRAQAEAKGGILTYAENKYPYYRLNEEMEVAS